MNIYYCSTDISIDYACDKILESGICYFGFDTETNTQGANSKLQADVLSIATGADIYVFHLTRCGFCPGVDKLLRNSKIIKIGVGLAGDLKHLAGLGYSVSSELDLQKLAVIKGYPLALDDLWITLFPQYPPLTKVNHQQVSWADPLTPALIEYSARDAHSALMLGQKMLAVPEAAALPSTCSVITDAVTLNTPVVEFQVEYQSYLTWIKQQLGQAKSLQTLINQTCNSYGRWIRMVPATQLPNCAREFLLRFVGNGDLEYNSTLKMFAPVTLLPDRVVLDTSLSVTDINAITRLKVKSARNYLYNSSTTFTCISNDMRYGSIDLALEQAAKQGRIEIVNDVIYPK